MDYKFTRTNRFCQIPFFYISEYWFKSNKFKTFGENIIFSKDGPLTINASKFSYLGSYFNPSKEYSEARNMLRYTNQ